MFIHKSLFLFSVIFLTIYFQPRNVWAGKEKPAEESKGGEKNVEKKDLPEWVAIQTQVSALNARIEQKREAIARLIAEKHDLPASSPEIKSVIDQMVSEHKEMLKLTEEFQKKLTIFKFRYPEKGTKESRKYGSVEVKSLDQMEQELGIDGRLNRNSKKIRSQYGAAPTEDSSSLEKTGKNFKLKNEANEPPSPQKSIDETGSIILKK